MRVFFDSQFDGGDFGTIRIRHVIFDTKRIFERLI